MRWKIAFEMPPWNLPRTNGYWSLLTLLKNSNTHWSTDFGAKLLSFLQVNSIGILYNLRGTLEHISSVKLTKTASQIFMSQLQVVKSNDLCIKLSKASISSSKRSFTRLLDIKHALTFLVMMFRHRNSFVISTFSKKPFNLFPHKTSPSIFRPLLLPLWASNTKLKICNPKNSVTCLLFSSLLFPWWICAKQSKSVPLFLEWIFEKSSLQKYLKFWCAIGDNQFSTKLSQTILYFFFWQYQKGIEIWFRGWFVFFTFVKRFKFVISCEGKKN